LIKEIFNLFDTDGEQQLDEEELAAAVFAMGFSQHNHVQVPYQHNNNGVSLISVTLQRQSGNCREETVEERGNMLRDTS
jgi:hypothetical protein